MRTRTLLVVCGALALSGMNCTELMDGWGQGPVADESRSRLSQRVNALRSELAMAAQRVDAREPGLQTDQRQYVAQLNRELDAVQTRIAAGESLGTIEQELERIDGSIDSLKGDGT